MRLRRLPFGVSFYLACCVLLTALFVDVNLALQLWGQR